MTNTANIPSRPEGSGWRSRLWDGLYQSAPQLETSKSVSSELSNLSNLSVENVDAPLFQDILKHMQAGESLKGLLRRVECLLGEESNRDVAINRDDITGFAAEEYKKEILFRQDGGYIRISEMDSNGVEAHEDSNESPKKEKEKQGRARAVAVKPSPAGSYKEAKKISYDTPHETFHGHWYMSGNGNSCIPLPGLKWIRRIVGKA